MPRFGVAALILMRVANPDGCRAMRGDWRQPVASARSCRREQTTVHRARMQLHWLGQTYGEPGRKHTGENTRDQIAMHESNIRWTRGYERPEGAALAIAPRAATSVSSSSGTHSTTQRTVF